MICVSAQSNADTFGTGANQFEIEFVEIGNPGNAADTTGAPNPVGSVDYIYNIGKFEISRGMIETANAESGLGINLADMTRFSGNGPDRPATGVTWNEAARFVNWLNSSKGFAAAYKFSTQPGDVGYVANQNILLWEEGDPGFDAANMFRNSLARYFLPNLDEWYKAAFYDPNANDGNGAYWNFATGSDEVPTAVVGGTEAGTAVYDQIRNRADVPADITRAGGLSPYGTMAQAGNALEWQETAPGDVDNFDPGWIRVLRGGDSMTSSRSVQVLSAERGGSTYPPWSETRFSGFRVASAASSFPPGDFDANGVLDAADIDLLTDDIQAKKHSPLFDLNNDEVVDNEDHRIWVTDLRMTWFGDANLDGVFNSGDLVDVFVAGKYVVDPNMAEMATWAEGDWNGDGFFDSGDLVLAFQDEGYVAGATPAVPEPTSMAMLLVGFISLASVLKSRGKPICRQFNVGELEAVRDAA